MADPFVAEIRIVGFNFAPTGWALCSGQLLPLSQNLALFSLLGTFYGGNGQSTFALPDLEGRAALHHDQGPGLSEYDLGQSSGTETVTLLVSEIAVHTHTLMSVNDVGDINQPMNNAMARSTGASVYGASGPPQVQLAPQALSPTGSSFPHNNLQPSLTLNFIIALQGVFPPMG